MPKKFKKNKNIGIIIAISSGILIGFFLILQRKTANLSLPQPDSIITPTPLQKTEINNAHTFSSDELGITFQYESNTLVKEIGNVVYLYDKYIKPEEGQSVEVFSKNPSDSLQTSIENTFLKGYSRKDCFVELLDGNFYVGSETKKESNLEIAIISYPVNQNSDVWAYENAKKCPSGYSQSNGIRYFQLNPEHPDKLLFFSIGQYAIYSGNEGELWQDTVQNL